jgi:hypothetical protein
MVTMSDRKGMIQKIEGMPSRLEATIQGLNDQQLDTPYGPGKWTIRQVVHHLADSHMNAFIRFKLAMTEDNPRVKAYDQDVWAAQSDANSGPVSNSLAIIKGLHARWAAVFNTLPESAYARTLDHPENGPMTVDDLLRIYSNHGEKHIGHIQGLKTAKNW